MKRWPIFLFLFLLSSISLPGGVLLADEESQSPDTPAVNQTPDTPAVSAAIQCDPQIYYGVKHCTDSGVHLLIVDLNDSRVSVQSVLSIGVNGECNSVNHRGKDSTSNCPGPPYPFERPGDMLARYRANGAVAVINTDYFAHTDKDHGAEGLAVKNGNRLDGAAHADTDGNATKRSSLAVSRTKAVTIGKAASESVDTQSTYYNVVGGGPMIVRNKVAQANSACDPNVENGISLSNCTDASQSAAGITSDGRLILITAQKDAYNTASYLVNNYSVTSALKFDGGGSARLAWLDSAGQVQSWGGTGENRAVAQGLVIFSNKIATCPAITAWKGEYWNNRDLSGTQVLCRNDGSVNFDWGGGGPGSGVNIDNFSARWTRTLNFTTGRYRFHLRGDDGLRLWVDNNQIINQWKDQGRTEYTADINLAAGNHSLKVEYYENGGDANVALWWETLATGSTNLARSRPSYATSRESSTLSPAQGNDGNASTRWSSSGSGANGEWWWVDLGAQTFDRVIVRWETAYAANHFIGWSNDAVNYTGYYYTISAPGSYQYTLGTRTARYVGIRMYRRAPCCSNYSFYELEVYRSAVAAADGAVEMAEPFVEAETLVDVIADGKETTVILDDPEVGKNWIFLPLVAN